MVDQMVRENMPSSQVIITKNQVFIAERILRSINSVLVGTDNSNVSQMTLERILIPLVFI
jgi:twitching motility protein PilJ